MVFEDGRLIHAEPLYINEPGSLSKVDIRLKE
jgi:hypothetical protein